MPFKGPPRCVCGACDWKPVKISETSVLMQCGFCDRQQRTRSRSGMRRMRNLMDGNKPEGFGKFDNLMRKLVKPAEKVMRSDLSKAAGEVASAIGNALGQSYKRLDGEWWLYTGAKAMRPLKADEVDWHVVRNHWPFVANGIKSDDPRWWDDPK